jgi:hypothetical protein
MRTFELEMANTVVLDFLACDVVFGTGLIIFSFCKWKTQIMQVDYMS